MPFPPTTSRIADGLNTLAASSRAFRLANPRLYTTAVLAGVITPFFMSNDERGYFDTATLTTPIITAGAMAAPTLFPALNKERKRLLDIIKKVPTDYDFHPGGDIEEAVASGRLKPSSLFAKRQAGRVHQPAKTAEQLESEFLSVKTAFLKEYAENPNIRRLLDNTMSRASIEQASAAEKAAMLEAKDSAAALAPALVESELDALFDARRGNTDWLSTVNHGLRQAQSAVAGDIASAPQIADMISATASTVEFNPLGDSASKKMLIGRHTDVYEALNKLIADQTDKYSIERFTVKSRDGVAGEILLDGKRLLSLPRPDGSIAMGSNLELHGVSLGFFGRKHGKESAPLHIIRALSFGNTPEQGQALAAAERDVSQYYTPGGAIARQSTTEMANHTWLLSGIPNDFPNLEREKNGYIKDGKIEGGFNAMSNTEKLAEQERGFGVDGFLRNSTESDMRIYNDPGAARLDWVGNTHQSSLTAKAAKQAGHAWVGEGLVPYTQQDFMNLPRVPLRQYKPSDAEHAFFERLPSWDEASARYFESFNKQQLLDTDALMKQAQALSMDYALTKTKAKPQMIAALAAEMGQNLKTVEGRSAVDAAWMKILPSISNKKSYTAVYDTLRYLGDGGAVVSKDVQAGYSLTRDFKVHENFLSAAQLNNGQIPGEWFDNTQPIGSHLRTNVFAKEDGVRHRVVGREQVLNEDGSLTYHVESQTLGMGGAKGAGTRKVTYTGAEGEVLQNARSVLQSFQDATGGGIIGEIDSIALGGKPKDPLLEVGEQMGGVFRDLQEHDAKAFSEFMQTSTGARGTFEQRLGSFGLSLNGKTLGRDTSKYALVEQAANEKVQLSNLMGEIMNQMGVRIQDGSLKGSPYLSGSANWQALKGLDFTNYVLKFGGYQSVAVPDAMPFGGAREIKITREQFTQMDLAGMFDVSDNYMAHVEHDGSVPMTKEFFLHTERPDGQNGLARPLGESIPLDQAVGTSSDMNLYTAAGRKGTIFDPKAPGALGNHSVQVSFGDKTYHVPVLGYEAYGGKTNSHDLFQYAPNEWEVPLKNVLSEAQSNLKVLGTLDPQSQAYKDMLAGSEKNFLAKYGTYQEAVRKHVGEGKQGILRAPAYHDTASEARITPRTSSLRYENGRINPYQVGVGDDFLKTLPNHIAKDLRAGGHTYGVPIRHPVNAMLPSQLVYDRNLGPRQVGVDPRLLKEIYGDADGDRLAAALLDGNISPGMLDKLQTSIMSHTSAHAHYNRISEAFKGADSLAGSNAGTNWFAVDKDGGKSEMAKFIDQPRKKGIIAATAGTNMSVGQADNLHSLLENSLAHNQSISDPLERITLHTNLFELVKQASIGAQKHGGAEGHVTDFTQLMQENAEIRKNFVDRSDRGYEQFMGNLKRAASRKDMVPANRSHVELRLATPEEFAGSTPINPFLRGLDKDKDLWKRFHRGHDRRIEQTQEILTSSGSKAARYEGPIVSHLQGTELFPNIQDLLGGLPAESRGAGASGAVNAATHEVAGEAGQIGGTVGRMVEDVIHAARNSEAGQFVGKAGKAAGGLFDHATRSAETLMDVAKSSSAGKALKIGAAVAVASGLLFSSIHSPREGQALAPSGNRFRPEETIGTQDRIPGEAEAGAMAPSNPPRMVRPANQGVRTAVVAPMGRTSQVEVQMTADDRDRAAEMSRIASRMAAGSGNSNVTLNYNDGTRLDSLRTREKVRRMRHT